MRISFRSTRAFTLVETLLVAGLMAVVGVAIMQTVFNGVKLYGRASAVDKQSEIAIFYDRIESDLRGAFYLEKIKFKGSALRFSFPAMIWLDSDATSVHRDQERIEQIGLIEYEFDPAERVIRRRQSYYGQALKGIKGSNNVDALTGIEDCTIRYYVATDRGFLSKTHIEDGVLPAAVLLECRHRSSKELITTRRLLPIYAGGF